MGLWIYNPYSERHRNAAFPRRNDRGQIPSTLSPYRGVKLPALPDSHLHSLWTGIGRRSPWSPIGNFHLPTLMILAPKIRDPPVEVFRRLWIMAWRATMLPSVDRWRDAKVMWWIMHKTACIRCCHTASCELFCRYRYSSRVTQLPLFCLSSYSIMPCEDRQNNGCGVSRLE